VTRKLTAAILAAVLAVAGLSVALLKKKEPAASPTPAATAQDTERSADTAPTQIEQVPRRTDDVFTPPATNATGSSPPPPK
jgi:hypothetical protein